MKKILIGVLLIISSSSYASTNLICGVFQGNAVGKPNKRIVMNLDEDRIAQSVFISPSQTFSIANGGESVTLGFSEAKGTTKTVITENLIRKMQANESIGIVGYRVNDEEKSNTAVCYLTGESTQAPFDL